MAKRLDGTSMFTGINAGLTNAFAQLNGQYSDGVTIENLNKALTNSNFINGAYSNGTFASYLTNNSREKLWKSSKIFKKEFFA